MKRGSKKAYGEERQKPNENEADRLECDLGLTTASHVLVFVRTATEDE